MKATWRKNIVWLLLLAAALAALMLYNAPERTVMRWYDRHFVSMTDKKTPTTPEKPNKPNKPDQPTTPTKPNQPTTPGKPTQPATPKPTQVKGSGTKTGDPTNAALPAAAGAIALAGLIVILARKKQHNK